MVSNEKMMQLIKRVHGLVESDNLEKQRSTQDNVGTLLNARKDLCIEEVDLGGMHGEWIRVNRMHQEKYVIFYCHGGGYMTGSSAYARSITTKLAEYTSMDVFCFDYRLAPEHPYPAALEDALKAWDYLMLRGYGAKQVIIAGDSAGGNLALALMLTLKEQKRFLPRGAMLLSPWTDLTCSGKTHETKAALDPVLNEEYIRKAISLYAPGCDLTDPKISPIFGDFSDFPPTYIQVGENEILQSDATSLYKKMAKDKVLVKLKQYDGMWHVFQMTPLKKAQEACESLAKFAFDLYK